MQITDCKSTPFTHTHRHVSSVCIASWRQFDFNVRHTSHTARLPTAVRYCFSTFFPLAKSSKIFFQSLHTLPQMTNGRAIAAHSSYTAHSRHLTNSCNAVRERLDESAGHVCTLCRQNCYGPFCTDLFYFL